MSKRCHTGTRASTRTLGGHTHSVHNKAATTDAVNKGWLIEASGPYSLPAFHLTHHSLTAQSVITRPVVHFLPSRCAQLTAWASGVALASAQNASLHSSWFAPPLQANLGSQVTSWQQCLLHAQKITLSLLPNSVRAVRFLPSTLLLLPEDGCILCKPICPLPSLGATSLLLTVVPMGPSTSLACGKYIIERTNENYNVAPSLKMCGMGGTQGQLTQVGARNGKLCVVGVC